MTDTLPSTNSGKKTGRGGGVFIGLERGVRYGRDTNILSKYSVSKLLKYLFFDPFSQTVKS